VGAVNAEALKQPPQSCLVLSVESSSCADCSAMVGDDAGSDGQRLGLGDAREQK